HRVANALCIMTLSPAFCGQARRPAGGAWRADCRMAVALSSTRNCADFVIAACAKHQSRRR
ncbi:MAG: hypothetical protein ACRESN_17200, partial [Pseudomonas sp.]